MGAGPQGAVCMIGLYVVCCVQAGVNDVTEYVTVRLWGLQVWGDHGRKLLPKSRHLMARKSSRGDARLCTPLSMAGPTPPPSTACRVEEPHLVP